MIATKKKLELKKTLRFKCHGLKLSLCVNSSNLLLEKYGKILVILHNTGDANLLISYSQVENKLPVWMWKLIEYFIYRRCRLTPRNSTGTRHLPAAYPSLPRFH